MCGCSLKPFFDAYVRGASMIDFDNYLRLAGLRMEVQLKKASSPDGTFIPDRRVRASLSSSGLPILSFYPGGAWTRAGLRSGDQLVKFNGSPVATPDDFFRLLKALHIGDRATLEVMRDGTARQVTVLMDSYDQPEVKIQELADPSDHQKAIFARWNAGQ